MRARAIVLTGAPPPSTLDWDSPNLLQDPGPFIASKDSSTCETPIRWRSLAPLLNPVSSTALSEQNLDGPSLFAGGKIDRYSGLMVDADDEALSEFYEHSFALHEGLGLFAEGDSLNHDTSLDISHSHLDTSLNDTSMSPSSLESSGKPPNALTTVGHLSDLEDIPDAAYLQSIAPHRVTVNLIVAIIHVSPRRCVRTRWGRETDIVEILVADETRSGFRVTCWLPTSPNNNINNNSAQRQTPLEQSLATLRPRDIVLFQCVALTSFRGQVYGQTLRYNMTKVDLLSRRPLDAGDPQGVFKWKKVVDTSETEDRQLRKVRKVWKWVMDFVGPAVAADVNADVDSEGVSLSGDEEAARNLPPDTQ